jgi:hypothetical protein
LTEGTVTTLTITIGEHTDPRVVTVLTLLLPDGAQVTHRHGPVPAHAALVTCEDRPSGRLVVTTGTDAETEDSEVWLYAALGAADYVVFLPEGAPWLARLFAGPLDTA